MSGIFVYAGVVGLLLGVASASFFEIHISVYVYVGFFVCAAAGGWFLRKNRHVFLVVLMCTTALLGFIRAQHTFIEREYFLDGLLGPAVLEGVVIKEPVFSETSQKVVIEVRRGESKERLLLIAPLYPEFVYGDTVRASGIVKKPEVFMTDTGTEFNYPLYLAKDRIAHQMVFPDTEILDHSGGNVFHTFLYSLRRVFIKTLRRYLPEPHATLAGGISIGVQDDMGQETEDIFRRVGLIHIVVLSGYNITIVADTVMRIFLFLPRVFMISSGAVTVVLFTIMTGATATAVRASVMALLAMLARVAGETYDISRALALAAAGMVWVNPYILLFDPSFQLSFLATFGLIHLTPFLERLCSFLPTALSLRQTVAATVATQAFVAPVLLLRTGSVSVISLAANIVVLPAVPVSMFLSSVLGVTGGLSSVVGVVVSFPTMLVLTYILRVAEILSDVPFASVSVGIPPLPVVLGMYGMLLGLIYKTRIRNKNIEIRNKP